MSKKKILVTGADGFIGSHVVEELLEEGYEVKAFVQYNSFNSWGWLDTFSTQALDKFEIVAGDIRDYNSVFSAMSNVDGVFHLAALIAIPYSYLAPESYIDTNIKGTLNVLMASKSKNLERVLITSTSEVYGTAKYVPIDELHAKQPQSPYSASKIGADSLSDSFYRSFDLPVTIVRPFNTYGPRQSARAIIPNVITQLMSGNLKIKLGDLTPTRDLVYVKDTAKGFVKIYQCRELIGEEVNIATQSEVSINKLVHELISQINPNAVIETDEDRLRPKKSEVFRLFGSNKKLAKYTNWVPSTDLSRGLKDTISWFQKTDNLNRYNSDIYNL